MVKEDFFEQLETERLILRKIVDEAAEIVEINDNSIKLAESLGMHYESTREDDYRLEDKYYNQKVYTILNKQMAFIN